MEIEEDYSRCNASSSDIESFVDFQEVDPALLVSNSVICLQNSHNGWLKCCTEPTRIFRRRRLWYTYLLEINSRYTFLKLYMTFYRQLDVISHINTALQRQYFHPIYGSHYTSHKPSHDELCNTEKNQVDVVLFQG